MIFNASAHAEARESVGIYDRSDLATSILYTAEHKADGLYIHGIPEDRADFLRRLAAECLRVADELDRPAVPALAIDPRGLSADEVAGKFREYQGGAL